MRFAQGDFAGAAACYREALAAKPDHFPSYSGLGASLLRQGDDKAAMALFDEATARDPANRRRYVILATDSYRRSLPFDREHLPAHLNIGLGFAEQGALDAAVEQYRRLLTIAPDDAETHFCLGMALLLKGDYRAGWPEYEWRRRMSDWGSTDQRALPMPLWRGEPLNGAPILLHAEQGLGDAIHFVRYATLVARRGGRVLLKVPASLHRLCSGLPGIERVVRDGEAVTAAWHCPLMSLPAAFGTEVATIPATPYLRADAAEAAAWAARLGPRLALRVGLVWAGAARFKRDQRRSLPLAAFGGLAALSGVEFYALQKGPAEKQLKNPPRGLKIHDLGADLGDFAATAAAINALDLVITVDTAVAHLAGAMGKPVWILLPFAPDWRWLTGRQDSPWYPTARLLRQPEPEDWRTVLARVAAELRQEAATAIFRR
jgi:hypothetical protein